MQINPGLSFSQLSASHLRIGSGFRALELTGVSEPVRSFIQRLQQGIPDGDEQRVAKAGQVPELDCHLLLSKLSPVLVSTPGEEHVVISADQDHRASLARLRWLTTTTQQAKLVGVATQY